MTEDKETMAQRGLSEWWSEETEYMFQRIERWAAFVRGYNRLRSQRWSKETTRDTWHAPSDEATSRFYTLKRSKWKSHPEETKINCCGTFNYQSNSKLESNCLETYRYDHSIYFKTIGDIRSDKRDVIRDLDQDRVSISSEELVEWDASSLADLIVDKAISEETLNNNHPDNRPDEPNVSDTVAERKEFGAMQNAWPIVDLSKLNLNLADNQRRDERFPCSTDQDDLGRNESQREVENNNVNSPENKVDKEDRKDESERQERIKHILSRKIERRSFAPIVGENNAVSPGVVLNCNNNLDIVRVSLQD